MPSDSRRRGKLRGDFDQPEDELCKPEGVVLTPRGVAVADYSSDRVNIFSSAEGAFVEAISRDVLSGSHAGQVHQVHALVFSPPHLFVGSGSHVSKVSNRDGATANSAVARRRKRAPLSF